MKRTQGVRLPWLAATVAYVALIFFMSSRPYLRPPGPEFPMKDKLAHFAEYAGLAILLWRAVAGSMSRDRVVTALAMLAIVATLAATDEVFQSRIPGRVTDVRDWLADLLGAAIATYLCAIAGRARQGPRGVGGSP